MNEALSIRLISAADCVTLRHAVLRPHQTEAECVYPGDEDPLSFHVGAFIKDRLICIASFFPQATERLSDSLQYRLRGMATHPDFRNQGIGSRVLARAEEIISKRSYPIVWCNARTTAAGYYTKLDYTAFPDTFDIPGIGPHHVMYKRLA